MKIDFYTKAVLTAIAIGLFWIGINTTASVSAGPDVQNVNLVEIEGKSIHYAKPIQVKIVDK